MTEQISIFKSRAGEASSREAYNAALARWPAAYEEQDVPTRFGATHLILGGPTSARPLILLHGQDSSATSWIYNIAALSQAFRTYALDTIGDLGKSRPTLLPKSREDYAAWLSDVLDQLQLKKADLTGISYGGFLAANFALACPERANRLVLLAPGIPNFGPPTLQWANYGMPMLFMPSRLTVRRFINATSTKGYSREDLVHEQMIIGMMNMRHVSFMRPVFTKEELMRMAAPTLLLIGDHEIMYEPRKALERAARLISDLQAELIPNAGHMLNGDQPELINKRILSFLAADSQQDRTAR
ncbi:MAG TPA: alpha/beta hydrolase [Anaerolineales bacterium]|nr:alpha/beta hydrolase [Anaerolineales bacterium]